MLNIQLLQGYLLLSSKKKSCELTTNAKKSKRLLKITDRAESDTTVEVCKSQTVHYGMKVFLKEQLGFYGRFLQFSYYFSLRLYKYLPKMLPKNEFHPIVQSTFNAKMKNFTDKTTFCSVQQLKQRIQVGVRYISTTEVTALPVTK